MLSWDRAAAAEGARAAAAVAVGGTTGPADIIDMTADEYLEYLLNSQSPPGSEGSGLGMFTDSDEEYVPE